MDSNHSIGQRRSRGLLRGKEGAASSSSESSENVVGEGVHPGGRVSEHAQSASDPVLTKTMRVGDESVSCGRRSLSIKSTFVSPYNPRWQRGLSKESPKVQKIMESMAAGGQQQEVEARRVNPANPEHQEMLKYLSMVEPEVYSWVMSQLEVGEAVFEVFTGSTRRQIVEWFYDEGRTYKDKNGQTCEWTLDAWVGNFSNKAVAFRADSENTDRNDLSARDELEDLKKKAVGLHGYRLDAEGKIVFNAGFTKAVLAEKLAMPRTSFDRIFMLDEIPQSVILTLVSHDVLKKSRTEDVLKLIKSSDPKKVDQMAKKQKGSFSKIGQLVDALTSLQSPTKRILQRPKKIAKKSQAELNKNPDIYRSKDGVEKFKARWNRTKPGEFQVEVKASSEEEYSAIVSALAKLLDVHLKGGNNEHAEGEG